MRLASFRLLTGVLLIGLVVLEGLALTQPFGLTAQVGYLMLWLVVATTVCWLALFPSPSLSDSRAGREMILWCVAGGVAAYLVGGMLAESRVNPLSAAAGLLYLALLYGSRGSPSLYPAALVGQIAGIVLGCKLAPIIHDGGNLEDLYALRSVILWCVGMTSASVFAATRLLRCRNARTLPHAADLGRSNSRGYGRPLHRASAIAILAILFTCIMPAARQRMIILAIYGRFDYPCLRANNRLMSGARVIFGRDCFDSPFRFQSSRANDSQLLSIARLTSLQDIDLLGSQVTDDGLSHLESLTRLTSLNVAFTNISDRGLEHIAKLSGLQQLQLQGTKITDDGLVHLYKLSALQSIGLDDARISPSAVERLKAALPKTRVVHLPKQLLKGGKRQ